MPDSFPEPAKPDPAGKPKRIRVLPQERFSENGRPTKRTVALEQKLLDAISRGAPYRIACSACGISEDAFAHWRRKDPAFQRRVDEADGKMALRLLGKIEKHSDETFAAAAWMLERKFPESFSRPEIQLMAAHNHTVVNSLSITISAEQARELATRSGAMTTRVAKLFSDWQNRTPETPVKALEPQPPSSLSVYGSIIPGSQPPSEE
jgi:hypothetical protein